jgi:hypothetical protein
MCKIIEPVAKDNVKAVKGQIKYENVYSEH